MYLLFMENKKENEVLLHFINRIQYYQQPQNLKSEIFILYYFLVYKIVKLNMQLNVYLHTENTLE